MTIYAVMRYDYYDFRTYIEEYYVDPERAWFEVVALTIQEQSPEDSIHYVDISMESIEVIV